MSAKVFTMGNGLRTTNLHAKRIMKRKKPANCCATRAPQHPLHQRLTTSRWRNNPRIVAPKTGILREPKLAQQFLKRGANHLRDPAVALLCAALRGEFRFRCKAGTRCESGAVWRALDWTVKRSSALLGSQQWHAAPT